MMYISLFILLWLVFVCFFISICFAGKRADEEEIKLLINQIDSAIERMDEALKREI